MTTPVRPRQRPENPFALKFTEEPERTYRTENPFYSPVGPPDLEAEAPDAIAEPPLPVAAPITARPPRPAVRGPEPEPPTVAPARTAAPVTRPLRVEGIDPSKPTDEDFRELLAELRAKQPTPTDIAEAAVRPAARAATATQLEEERRFTVGGRQAEELGVGRPAERPLTAGMGPSPGASAAEPVPSAEGPLPAGGLKQGLADFVNTAREHLYDQRALPSPRRKRDLKLTRAEDGSLTLEPEDMQDLEAGMGEMLGGLVDIPTLASFVGGMAMAEGAVRLAAKKGVPLAMRWVQMAAAPRTAPIAERMLAGAVRGGGTGGTGAVFAETAGTLAEEGRLPTPAEAGTAFAGGTVAIAALGAAGPAVGALSARLAMMGARPGPRDLGPRIAQAVRDRARARPQGPKESDTDFWVRRTEEELGFARRVLGVGRGATEAKINAAYDKAVGTFHPGQLQRPGARPKGGKVDAELLNIYADAANIARIGAQKPKLDPINRALRIPSAGEPPPGEPPPRAAEPAEAPVRAPEPAAPAYSEKNPFKPGIRQRVADVIDP
ncbi:hypothetical protein LCGC14_2165860, partial [marine sediment metagenome]